MIIALDCLVIIPKCVKLWLEVGLSSKNKLWYTKIQELYDQMGESVCLNHSLRILLLQDWIKLRLF